MSMQITESGPVAGKPVEAAGKLPSRASNRKSSDRSSEAATGSRATILSIHPELGRFASADDRLNAIAANARTADKRAAVVSEAISRMKDTLENITKNYPPFPPGSEERVRLLKSYAALRKQIAQMTVPPEQDAGAPRRKPEHDPAGIYTYLLQGDGRVQTVPRADVRVGPSGLVIPEIQPSATDAEIREVIGRLENARESLQMDRARAEAETLAGAMSELSERKGPALGSPAIAGGGEYPEQAVEDISMRIMDELTIVEGGLLHTSELRLSLAGVSSWR